MRWRGDLRALGDEELMELAAGGDMRAFELVFDRHGTVAFSLAYRICRRRAMAEDVVQEAFLTVWRHAVRYDRRRGSVRSWILSIVHSRAIDALRRALVRERPAGTEERLAEPTTADEPIETEVLRRDDARRVKTALAQLPVEQRRVIELAYFGGLTHREITDRLGLPAGTVKGRIRLGLHKLRALLDEGALRIDRGPAPGGRDPGPGGHDDVGELRPYALSP